MIDTTTFEPLESRAQDIYKHLAKLLQLYPGARYIHGRVVMYQDYSIVNLNQWL